MREARFHEAPPANEAERRSAFQRDRDRILYSSAFRRLAGVTQVVGASEGFLFHNRLTHSLKVAQLGRRIAEKLIQEQPELAAKTVLVDPDVVEAAGLAHDLGHPPFGHVAEMALKKAASSVTNFEAFEGNPQSFRIVTKLSMRSFEHDGLNLTREAAEEKEPNVLPLSTRDQLLKLRAEGKDDDSMRTRLVVDLIASMTETQALETYQKLTGLMPGSGLDLLLHQSIS